MRYWPSLWVDRRGAVAPTVALSLVGLIAVGGLAVDYARLESLDTELQQAADQAALGAATQLDQQSGAIARATAAAQGLLSNNTLFANSTGRKVNIPSITFYATAAAAEATNGTSCPTANAVTSDATARFVCVQTSQRASNYALTPIVGLMSSGNLSGMAVAGLGSAICKTPPVMICNPQETGTNTSFDPSLYVGDGLKLVSVGNGGGAWVPGNFGYLNSGGGSNGAPGLREALGWTNPPGDCLKGSGVDTKPGATVSVTDAVNTRFDIYDSNQACPSGGSCPASINARKDVVRPGNANGNNACALHNQGWQEVASADQYLPTSATTPLATSVTPKAIGYPRDMCHAVSSGGSCSGGAVGDGLWDRDAYFRVNYRRSDNTYWGGGTGAGTWRANTGLPANATRYQVYQWEIDHLDQVIDGVTILGSRVASGNGANALTAYGKPQCSASEGYGSGSVPGGSNVDRRRISVAVVNCTANNVNGSSTGVPVERWIEAFLVQPSLNRARTSQGDIYIEIIGETKAGGAGATAGQVVRRDVPYLLK